jgi:hypothetical protein
MGDQWNWVTVAPDIESGTGALTALSKISDDGIGKWAITTAKSVAFHSMMYEMHQFSGIEI